jgi:uncharacterized protein YgbK (DUF1537 family)
MNAHFAILADDLSGAADCAVPFARAGFSTEVYLRPESIPGTRPAVTSIDLNTRELAPIEALRATSHALKLLQSNRETVWYRKVDSTLRGNIGSDVLATVREISGKRVIICAPAFPDAGRTTIQGNVFVHGTPLDKSAINVGWAPGKSIPDLFAAVGLETQVLSLDVIRSGCSNVLRHIKNGPDPLVVICDAITNLDLSVVAEAGLQLRRECIFVGSAGLASQIAVLWEAERTLKNQIVFSHKPILVVVGSRSQVSRAQFNLLSNSIGIDILRIPVTSLGSENDPSIIAGLTRALAHERDVAITTELDRVLDPRRGAARMEVLGRTLRPFLHQFAALVLTGGETARALLFQSNIDRLRMIDEIEPGVTLSIALGEFLLPIVMKAGAFGKPATLLNAVLFLRNRKG